MITIGLVAEGWHDYLMLEPLISAELGRRTTERLSFKHLHPMQDATGSYDRGGWSKVLAWCISNSGDGLETYFTPLFAGDPACDLIVVHLDGDALESLGPHTVVSVPDGPIPVSVRIATLTSIVEDWLKPDPERRRRLALALPVQHTEAWILCAEGVVNCEEVDAKTLFRGTFSRRGGHKLSAFYKRRSNAIRVEEQRMEKSISYQSFCGELNRASINDRLDL
jgi:hypothetical protein